MFKRLLEINNYKLFLINMTILGMAIAVTAPYLVIYMTETHGIATSTFGIFMACAALGSFIVNTIVGKKSDIIRFERKYIIILALIMLMLAFISYVIIDNHWLLMVTYIIFASLGAPAMPQLYAIARESINAYDSKIAVFANTVLRSMFSFGFLFGPMIGAFFLGIFGFEGLFIGTVMMVAIVLGTTLFIRTPKVNDELITVHIGRQVEDKAPNLLKSMSLLLPFVAFIMLHVGQWGYLLNMPLYVTHILELDESYVGILASLCAGLEVPLMIFVGYIASRLGTKTLLIIGSFCGSMYFLSIDVFREFNAMLIGQIPLAIFLAILLGLGISYFQDLLPKFPGYASTLFANAMIIGQLVGNLIGGWASEVIGLEYTFYVSGSFLFIAFLLFFFTEQEVRSEG